MALEGISLAFSVAQTLLSVIQSSSQLKELFSVYGDISDLDSLERTVKSIKSLLGDADAKGALNQQEIDYVEQLKDGVYDANDLIDEFVTLTMQHQLLDNEVGGGFSEKVDNKPIERRREETCSHLYGKRIIGRQNELSEIVGTLLEPNEPGNNVSFLTIVGIGGLGKTALAKLLYHHEMIERKFTRKWWVCVADEDQRTLHVEGVLRKILDVATGHSNHHLTSKELLVNRLQSHLAENKFLLILDDVWNENRNEWLKLEEFLMEGREGSWVVLTSRSKETARIVGNGIGYELRGLSAQNSWNLFEMMAFDKDKKEPKYQDNFVEVGKHIVEKCVGVPLAIRVVGSLLYGQEVEIWRTMRNSGIGSIGNDPNGIKSILEFSYHHLDSPLKSCFSYCAVFPKDFIIEKDMLIRLWMAQGYIELEDKGQCLEDIGEGYFLVLLRRSFFQDVQRNVFGKIISCKMHDLMHDVAMDVAGKEIRIVNTLSDDLDKNTRHLCLVSKNSEEGFGTMTKLRTFVTTVVGCFASYRAMQPVTLANLGCLRVLDLRNRDYKGLNDPLSAIGKLVHLRYLDLSYSKNLKQLPGSITKLCNLQTLILYNCISLEVLPKDFSKLVKLRVFELFGCPLMHMPVGMNMLTCLRELTFFKIADGNQSVGQLKDLGPITHLRGELNIKISKNALYSKKDDREAGFLANKEHLKCLFVSWNFNTKDNLADECEHQHLLDDLEPHPNLEELIILRYPGVTIPRWMREEHLATYLPHLVNIRLYGFRGLQFLPSFAKLPKLKSLNIEEFDNLKVMENTNSSCTQASTSGLDFFPSLTKLALLDLPKLKGWWRGVTGEDDYQLPLFPCLSELDIKNCPSLTCIPLCPMVGRLILTGDNKRLQPVMRKRSACSREEDNGYQLRYVKLIHNTGYLKSLPFEALEVLVEMTIGGDEEAENLSEIGEEVLRSCSSSLRQLTIKDCPKLRNFSVNGDGVGLGHLTALVELSLEYLKNMDFTRDGGGGDMPWSSIGASLRRLTLRSLPKLVNLPKGMRHLTTLQTLDIYNCNLKTLPDWIGCFSSLESLKIWDCLAIGSIPEALRELTSLRILNIYSHSEALKERCQKPNGLDWPKIKDIPSIVINLIHIQ